MRKMPYVDRSQKVESVSVEYLNLIETTHGDICSGTPINVSEINVVGYRSGGGKN